jgi:hypothetical protein
MNTVQSTILTPLLILLTIAMIAYSIVEFANVQQAYKVAETAQTLSAIWHDPQLREKDQVLREGNGTYLRMTEAVPIAPEYKRHWLVSIGYDRQRAEQLEALYDSLDAGSATNVKLPHANISVGRTFSLLPSARSRVTVSGSQTFGQVRDRLQQPPLLQEHALSSVSGVFDGEAAVERMNRLAISAPVINYTQAMRTWDLAYCTVGSAIVHAVSRGNVVDSLLCMQR